MKMDDEGLRLYNFPAADWGMATRRSGGHSVECAAASATAASASAAVGRLQRAERVRSLVARVRIFEHIFFQGKGQGLPRGFDVGAGLAF